MKLNERLKNLRAERHIGQIQLAKETGLSKSSIARWELGLSEPNASALAVLAKYFNVSVDYLIGLIDY
ncbi:MAG: helix-turn-helix domain-containing protein [Clostridia bacterium]|nr:helix-turn-helix domain-containing protein [Clostridia bacterium]